VYVRAAGRSPVAAGSHADARAHACMSRIVCPLPDARTAYQAPRDMDAGAWPTASGWPVGVDPDSVEGWSSVASTVAVCPSVCSSSGASLLPIAP
jgi:hypothetical protein